MTRTICVRAACLAVAIALAGCGGDVATPDGGTSSADLGTAAPDGGDPVRRCAVITDSVKAAGFGGVSVRCDAEYAWIVSSTEPDHPMMDGITGTNDQVPVPAPGYASPAALVPVRAATPTTIDAALGVAVNGVPIYDYTSQGMNDPGVYDPRADTKLTGELDLCNGHSGRGDDYHYHAAPVCMMAAMKNKGPGAVIGWAFDGYPIYGNTNPDGTPIPAGTLDVCNAQADPVFGARHHTSDTHPYIIQCLVGRFDLTRAPHVHPLDLSTARISLRDGHVEILAELDLLLLVGADPTAVATAPEPALVAHLDRARRRLETETRLVVDGEPVELVLRELPAPPELRALAATLSAAQRDHGALASVRLEAPRPVIEARTLALSLPPALGPTLVTFVQPATRHAAPGRPAAFAVLMAPPPRADRTLSAVAALLGAIAIAAVSLAIARGISRRPGPPMTRANP